MRYFQPFFYFLFEFIHPDHGIFLFYAQQPCKRPIVRRTLHAFKQIIYQRSQKQYFISPLHNSALKNATIPSLSDYYSLFMHFK